MQRVIVTVKRKGEDERHARDLEVPSHIEARQLAEMITRGLHWDASERVRSPIYYKIEAYPPGRILQPDESLESAGVWDGSILILVPADVTQPTGLQQPHLSDPSLNPQSGPVVTWRSIETGAPREANYAATPQPPPSGEEKPISGFVWKRVDK